MNSIITRTTKTSFSGNMLCTEMFDNVEVDINDVKENYDAAMKLTGGKKYLSLVMAAPFSTITKEAREITNKEFMYKNTVAQAIVVHSIANRLMGNFLVKFYKPFCPLKLFKNKEDAVMWLNEKWNNQIRAKVKTVTW
jgi:hypothetical protein